MEESVESDEEAVEESEEAEEDLEESEEDVVAEGAESDLKPVSVSHSAVTDHSPVAKGGAPTGDAPNAGAMSSGGASEGKKPAVKMDQQTTRPNLKKA